MCGEWMLLVTALNPTVYLAYGASVVTTGLILWRMVHKMLKLADETCMIIEMAFNRVAHELLTALLEDEVLTA